MMTKTFASIPILVFVVLIITEGCATKQKATPEEELYKYWVGTWINSV